MRCIQMAVAAALFLGAAPATASEGSGELSLGPDDAARIASSFDSPRARCEELYRLIAAYPGTAIAEDAAFHLQRLQQEEPQACWLRPPQQVRERAGGEVELVLSQAILGVGFAGVVLPSAMGVNTSTEMPAYLGLAGFAGGATAGLIASQFRVTTGQAMTVSTIELLGGWNALAIEMVRTNTGHKGRDLYAATGIGVGAGAVLGAATAAIARPDAGDMALIRSGGTWGTLASYGALVHGQELGPRRTVPRLALGTDAGALTGLLLATRLDWSRERVNIVDLAGYAGLLGGWAASDLSRRHLGPEAADAATPLIVGGGVAGLLAGTLATRGMGDSGAMGRVVNALPKVQVLPQPDGSWSFGLGMQKEL